MPARWPGLCVFPRCWFPNAGRTFAVGILLADAVRDYRARVMLPGDELESLEDSFAELVSSVGVTEFTAEGLQGCSAQWMCAIADRD